MSDPEEDEYEYNLLVASSDFHQGTVTDKEKPQVHRKTNYLTKYIYPVENTRMRINHLMIALFFRYEIN